MSTLATIAAGDSITNSRTDINNNFDALNTDKIETSVIDTDTAMAANSDAKIPSQKAVKTYIDTSGGLNASSTVRGIVELATSTEINSGSATGATGAGIAITPDQLVLSRYRNTITPNAGATITGATLPVPVYQNKTDNEVYACDANDTAATKFLGFAVSNSTNGNAITVQTGGVVGGFTGLDEGEKYYVQDAVGTIGTTPGTLEILVGEAISTTELVIMKGKRFLQGTTSFTSTTTTAITLGFRPSKIRIHAVCVSANQTAESHGGWTHGNNACVNLWHSPTGSAGGAGAEPAKAWFVEDSGGTTLHSGTVTTITDTGFTLDNTENSGGETVYIFWEAEGEL